jgi:DNA-directed RNA polymerase subunit M/transcription elongation factor TFIIS
MSLEKVIPHHPQRKKVFEKFLNLLLLHIDKKDYHYSDEEIQKMALNIERGIFNSALLLYRKKTTNETWNAVFKNIYLNKSVIIYDNLNPNGNIQNTGLLERLLQKNFNEFELCSFSSDKLFPEKHKALMEMYCPNPYRDVPRKMEQPDGLFKCGKCKSYKTEYSERQTRSADEPTTKFCYCHNCGNRWRFC